MPVAPRYSPEGVRIGEMPTPRVSAQTGLAEGLASVGESIAGIGKTIGQTVERSQAMADHAAKFKMAADDAVAQDAFERYKRDKDADYVRLKTDANGVNIAKARGAFDASINGDVQGYVKDLTPEQQAAFEKRRQFQNETYQKAADNVTHERSVSFIAEKSTGEVKAAIDAAATASAKGETRDYITSIGRAIAAGRNRETATGEPFVTDNVIAEARYKGLSILVEESPEKAIAYYQKHQGQMGQYSDNAAKLVQVSADKVSVQKHMEITLAGARDADGNLDPVLAAQSMAKAEQQYAEDPLLRMDDQRKQVAQEQFSRVMAAESASRKATGDAVLNNIDALYAMPDGHNKAKKYVETAEGAAALKRMLPPDKLALTKKLLAGPLQSDESERAELNALLDSATTEKDIAAVEALAISRVLSVKDREQFQQRLKSGKDALVKADGNIRKSVKSMWEDAYQRNVPSWKDSGAERQLTDGEKGDISSYKAHADAVWELLKNNPKATETDIQKAFQAVAAKVRVPTGGGGVIDKTYAETTVSERSNAKAAQKKEDRRNAAMEIINKRRMEAGLGEDPGAPDDSFIGNIIPALREEAETSAEKYNRAWVRPGMGLLPSYQ